MALPFAKFTSPHDGSVFCTRIEDVAYLRSVETDDGIKGISIGVDSGDEFIVFGMTIDQGLAIWAQAEEANRETVQLQAIAYEVRLDKAINPPEFAVPEDD